MKPAQGNTLKTSLIFGGMLFTLFVSVARSAEQPSEKDAVRQETFQVAVENAKELICEHEFDAAIQGIKALSSRYPQLSTFEQNALIQKELVKDEGGMYYGLYFTENCVPMKRSLPIDALQPYLCLSLSFSLRTGHYGGQADIQPYPHQGKVLSIDDYVELRRIEGPIKPIQHQFPSGITMFASALSDDETLRSEIYTLFNAAIDHLLKWESEPVSRSQIP